MPGARRDWVGAALHACVLEHDWTKPPRGLASFVVGRDLQPLVERASHHGVANLLYLSLRGIDGVHRPSLEKLERNYQQGVRHHLLVLGELSALGAALDEASIPWIVFKGPVLSTLVYPRPDLRFYGDVDVMVPRPEFGAAVQALEGRGFAVLDRNWELLLRLEAGQLHVGLGHDVLADLHWHPLNRNSVRRSFAISPEELFARARTAALGSLQIRRFDLVDGLLHLCVHAGLSGGVRLLWLKDIERTIAREAPDWLKVAERARAWRAEVLVAGMLQRARRAVGARVPEEVLDELAPSRVGRAVDTLFDRIWPPESSHLLASPSASWMRYRRQHLVTSLGAFARRMRVGLWSRAARSASDDEDAFPAFVPSGDASTRSAFFELVSNSPEP
jgi:hypothetical protein